MYLRVSIKVSTCTYYSEYDVLISVSARTYKSQLVNYIRDHCIIRHSLRYFRYSGLVIYKSKLPSPSISMPCDYRILQSPTKGQVKLVLWETVGRSHIHN